MKTVITYGTFDLFHYGHYMLLKRARALGDRLIVGVSTDRMCRDKGKVCTLPQDIRMSMVRDLAFVDAVFPEETMEQKIQDVDRYGADIFVLGSDYETVFPQMAEYSAVARRCEVVFLPRTPDISTSDLKSRLLEQLKMAENQTQKGSSSHEHATSL